MAKDIPGWKRVSKLIGLQMDESQQVDGSWYIPEDGAQSLQKLVDEWMEELWSAYHFHTYVGKGGERVGVVSDGKHALRILKEWGKVDEQGHVKVEPEEEE